MYTENDSGSWLNEDSSRFENRDPQFNLFEPVLELVSAEISKYEEKTGKTIIRIAGACGEAPLANFGLRICLSHTPGSTHTGCLLHGSS